MRRCIFPLLVAPKEAEGGLASFAKAVFGVFSAEPLRLLLVRPSGRPVLRAPSPPLFPRPGRPRGAASPPASRFALVTSPFGSLGLFFAFGAQTAPQTVTNFSLLCPSAALCPRGRRLGRPGGSGASRLTAARPRLTASGPLSGPLSLPALRRWGRRWVEFGACGPRRRQLRGCRPLRLSFLPPRRCSARREARVGQPRGPVSPAFPPRSHGRSRSGFNPAQRLIFMRRDCGAPEPFWGVRSRVSPFPRRWGSPAVPVCCRPSSSGDRAS